MQYLKLVNYSVVGVSTAIVYLSFGYFLSNYQQLGSVASANISYVLAIIVNYILHHKYTFRSSSPYFYSLPKYIASIGLGFSINAIVVYICVNHLNIDQVLSQVVAMLAVIIANFFVFNFWVFKNNRQFNEK